MCITQFRVQKEFLDFELEDQMQFRCLKTKTRMYIKTFELVQNIIL